MQQVPAVKGKLEERLEDVLERTCRPERRLWMSLLGLAVAVAVAVATDQSHDTT